MNLIGVLELETGAPNVTICIRYLHSRKIVQGENGRDIEIGKTGVVRRLFFAKKVKMIAFAFVEKSIIFGL
jgi:hypothetical protein